MRPKRVLFIGSKRLGLRILQQIHLISPGELVGVVTIDDQSDGRSTHKEFIDFCAMSKLSLSVAATRKDAETVLAKYRPDLCIVVGWYWLIPKRLLDSVAFGFVGIHNSLLPSYRGGAPVVWQIINGESRAGFSLFKFGPGMDDGPIWAQGAVDIGPNDYIETVLEKLEIASIEAFRETYPKILEGVEMPVEQGHINESYCAQRFPSDGIVDWSLSAPKVYNLIRAQAHPYPGAFTFLEGKKLMLWRASLCETSYFGSPGQVVRITGDAVQVACGEGTAINLLDVEIDGTRGAATELIKSTKHRMSASINGKLQ